MSTVAARTFASSPARAADLTWAAIVAFLTRGENGADHDALMAVSGTASALIADRAPETAAIVVTGDGPRTRIRCVYDEDALDGTGVNEETVGFEPLKGDWALSLPCPAEDLAWVQASLARHSSRITARDLAEAIKRSDEATADTSASAFEIDVKGFLS
jgi:hypothetical protein